MVFGNGVKNIQAAAYNGALTVFFGENDPKTWCISCCYVRTRSASCFTALNDDSLGSIPLLSHTGAKVFGLP